MIRRTIPHLFTAGNLIGGVLAIILTLKGRVDLAPYCLMLSAFLDFLDGFVARALGVSGELGKQLDSLADMVSFGVAPGIIMFHLIEHKVLGAHFLRGFYPMEVEYSYQWSSIALKNLAWYQEISLFVMPGLSKFLPLAALAIPFFAMFRLAKFNIDEHQKDGFIGLPTPAATIVVLGLSLLIANSFNQTAFGSWPTFMLFNQYFLVLMSLVLGIMMVVPIQLFSLKFSSFGLKGNEIRYVFLTISLILLATLFCWALPLIILLYIFLSLFNNLSKKSA
jgi:CDP-diacylglycerol--serine O-phosphatidyltransferase